MTFAPQDNAVLGKFTGRQPTGLGAAFQRETVARLTTYCERMIRAGEVSPKHELHLRTLVNLACNAFDMAPVQDKFEQDLNAIREVMEQKS